MKRVVICALLMASVILAGCRAKISEGVVIQKDFEPARVATQLMPQWYYIGDRMQMIMISQVISYPDQWTVIIQKFDSEQEKNLTATYAVTEAEYDSVEIGDLVSFASGQLEKME